jgi:hypothetical protein
LLNGFSEKHILKENEERRSPSLKSLPSFISRRGDTKGESKRGEASPIKLLPLLFERRPVYQGV